MELYPILDEKIRRRKRNLSHGELKKLVNYKKQHYLKHETITLQFLMLMGLVL